MKDYRKNNALAIRPLRRQDEFCLCGCEYVDHYRDEERDADIFVFNDPYMKVNVDLVVMKGQLCVSAPYGETMDRSTIYYLKA